MKSLNQPCYKSYNEPCCLPYRDESIWFS
jgi:hypothetical protein